jgi:hypothetical protein
VYSLFFWGARVFQSIDDCSAKHSRGLWGNETIAQPPASHFMRHFHSSIQHVLGLLKL